MKLAAIPAPEVDRAWVDCLPFIKRVCEQWPDYTIADAWQSLRSGRAELWIFGSEEDGIQGAIITELKSWEGDIVGYVIGLGTSDTGDWLPLREDFCRQMQARGATRLIFQGRNGFERVWPEAKVLRKLYEVRF